MIYGVTYTVQFNLNLNPYKLCKIICLKAKVVGQKGNTIKCKRTVELHRISQETEVQKIHFKHLSLQVPGPLQEALTLHGWS